MTQSESISSDTLHELGYKIFLDRYALKDVKRVTLKAGDTVIVSGGIPAKIAGGTNMMKIHKIGER